MDKNLKKDIFNYLISIIIPGAVNFFSIPIIKWLLKAEGYGEYALWFNAFLIVISGSVSWLGMSIVRFRAEFQNADFFYRNIGRIVLWLPLSLFFLIAGDGCLN